jgi:hypothetical protein
MKLKLIKRKSRKSSPKKKGNTNKRKQSTSRRNMAKRKTRKSTRKSSGSKGGLFSGKVLGFKIPVIDKVFKNKTFQKIAVASGTVSLLGSGIALINNPQINALWQKPLVKDAVALSTGDIVGAIGRKVIENPQLIGQVTGRGSGTSQQSSSQAGFA